ncbi:MAG: helix-turn-helix transcriptional regulator [Alphaproteobacteria bacterium]|nr:helix-turn-helix transcriptional regulator [Alphaproteobacteria bacterium]
MYRKLKRLSQIELAIAVGVDRSYLSEIENGRTNVSVNVLYAIADSLEVPITDLLTSAEDKNC